MHRHILAAGLLTLGMTLTACGGGSGGGSYTAPAVPTSAPSTAPSSAPAAQAGNAKTAQVDGGSALIDAVSGLALYTFDGDTVPNQSTCTGSCLTIWPAHSATSSDKASGNFTIFTRSDGTLQWAYKGKPLYTFVSDTPSNNGTGEGLQGFHIARP